MNLDRASTDRWVIAVQTWLSQRSVSAVHFLEGHAIDSEVCLEQFEACLVTREAQTGMTVEPIKVYIQLDAFSSGMLDVLGAIVRKGYKLVQFKSPVHSDDLDETDFSLIAPHIESIVLHVGQSSEWLPGGSPAYLRPKPSTIRPRSEQMDDSHPLPDLLGTPKIASESTLKELILSFDVEENPSVFTPSFHAKLERFAEWALGFGGPDCWYELDIVRCAVLPPQPMTVHEEAVHAILNSTLRAIIRQKIEASRGFGSGGWRRLDHP